MTIKIEDLAFQNKLNESELHELRSIVGGIGEDVGGFIESLDLDDLEGECIRNNTCVKLPEYGRDAEPIT